MMESRVKYGHMMRLVVVLAVVFSLNLALLAVKPAFSVPVPKTAPSASNTTALVDSRAAILMDRQTGFVLRMYAPSELAPMLSRSGFDWTETYGNYDASTYGALSRGMFVMARKPALAERSV